MKRFFDFIKANTLLDFIFFQRMAYQKVLVDFQLCVL